MLRPLLITFFVGLMFAVRSQDCLWMTGGLGISGGKKTVMAHVVIGATYLRRDRFGVTFGVEANSRMRSRRQSNSLQSFGSGYACIVWNMRPYYGTKLLLRAGPSTGTYRYVGRFLYATESQGPILLKTEKHFATRKGESAGLFLSVESVFEGSSYDRAWSLEIFGNLACHSYVGLRLRFNVGALA